MTSNVINCTGHEITLGTENWQRIPPSQHIARIVEKTEIIHDMVAVAPECSDAEQSLDCNCMNVPILKLKFGKTIGLPEYQEGVYLIVSSIIANANPNRTDLICPITYKKDGKIFASAFRIENKPRIQKNAEIAEMVIKDIERVTQNHIHWPCDTISEKVYDNVLKNK